MCHADALRGVYVELPLEDSGKDFVHYLKKLLYRARAPAQNWTHAYVDFMEKVYLKKENQYHVHTDMSKEI